MSAAEPRRPRTGEAPPAAGPEPAPLVAERVTRRFAARRARRAGGRDVVAVEEVSIELRPGETLALVGESGSGKSTLGRLLVGLERPDAGEVRFDGVPLEALDRAGRRRFRRRVQMVFQDPYASLDPRLTVGGALREVLHVHGLARGRAAEERIAALLERVGLDADAARRYPHAFSGGQRQRIGIARALAVEPALLIADEPVSALDVSVQAKILDLMLRLQRDLGLGYLFISHDLAVVRVVADRVAVMKGGRVVEIGSADAVYRAPREEYTKALFAAVPRLPHST